MGRPEVAKPLLEAGVFEVAAAHLHKSSPVEWVNWRCAEGLQAGTLFTACGSLCQTCAGVPGVNATQLLVDSGMAGAITSLLKGYELRGAQQTESANVFGLFHAIWALISVDLTAPEARPIVQLLEGMGSALRFVLDHPLEHV